MDGGSNESGEARFGMCTSEEEEEEEMSYGVLVKIVQRNTLWYFAWLDEKIGRL